MDIKTAVQEALKIEGLKNFAIVDLSNGMLLGGNGPERGNLELAAAGNSEVIKSKLKVMKMLGINEKIEDILITIGSEFHLIRLSASKPNIFLYLSIYKEKGNLALARYKIADIENQLVL